jgi:plasminogen activator inhibitor 1 RNA-binding protein
MSNRFAALDLEDDEPVVQQPKAPKAKTEVKAKPAATEKPAAAARPAPVKAAATPAVAGEEAPASRARRGGKPPGGGRKTPHTGRGREFDRHVSGTGRGKETAKEGAGKFAWGKEGDETKEPIVETEGEVAEAVEAEPVVEEEPDNTLTLEQHNKLVAAKREGALFQTVQADNSALLKQLGDAKPLQKKTDDEFAFLLGTKSAPKAAAAKSTEDKATVASLLAFKVGTAAERAERPERPARAPRPQKPEGKTEGKDAKRGGRGGARGGRGGARTERPAGPKVKLSDVDFPSL